MVEENWYSEDGGEVRKAAKCAGRSTLRLTNSSAYRAPGARPTRQLGGNDSPWQVSRASARYGLRSLRSAVKLEVGVLKTSS